MAKRADVIEFAVLGLLHEGPMHGYVLRKRLAAVLGGMTLVSYGSLYPALRRLVVAGLIREARDRTVRADRGRQARSRTHAPTRTSADGATPALGRTRVVYEITAEGKERFQDALGDAGPESWDDDRFGVRMAFFSRTDREVRLRILEGRRARLEERLGILRASLARMSERIDEWSSEVHRHGLEGVEREVRWLDELIQGERSTPAPTSSPGSSAGSASTRTDSHH